MDGWVVVKEKSKKLIGTNEVSSNSTLRSNNYFEPLVPSSTTIDPYPPKLATLPTQEDDSSSTTTQPCSSRRQLRKRHARHILHLLSQQEDAFLNKAIASAEHERTSLAKAKRNEAIAAFIYGDFISNALPISDEPQLYTNSAMPADLQAAEKLAVASRARQSKDVLGW